MCACIKLTFLAGEYNLSYTFFSFNRGIAYIYSHDVFAEAFFTSTDFCHKHAPWQKKMYDGCYFYVSKKNVDVGTKMFSAITCTEKNRKRP